MRTKIYAAALLLVFLVLQYNFWSDDGNISNLLAQVKAVELLEKEVEELKNSNQSMLTDIKWLKSSPEAAEGLARARLGMIKKGETFYQVIEPVD